MEVVYLIGDLDLEGEGAFEGQAEGPRNPEQEGECGAINSKEIIAIVACVVIVAPTLPKEAPPVFFCNTGLYSIFSNTGTGP